MALEVRGNHLTAAASSPLFPYGAGRLGGVYTVQVRGIQMRIGEGHILVAVFLKKSNIQFTLSRPLFKI